MTESENKTLPFNEGILIKGCDSLAYNIYIAGSYEEAQRTLRKYCSENGACFSISKNKYIYSGGEEDGIVVHVMNYPRFPKSQSELYKLTEQLAIKLMYDLNQGSYTIEPCVNTHRNYFYSRRKDD